MSVTGNKLKKIPCAHTQRRWTPSLWQPMPSTEGEELEMRAGSQVRGEAGRPPATQPVQYRRALTCKNNNARISDTQRLTLSLCKNPSGCFCLFRRYRDAFRFLFSQQQECKQSPNLCLRGGLRKLNDMEQKQQQMAPTCYQLRRFHNDSPQPHTHNEF